MRKYFLLTNSKGREEAPLYTRIRKKKPYLDIWINTHIDVNVQKWEKAFEELALYARSSRDGRAIEILVQDVDKAIDEAVKSDFTRESVQEAVDAVVYREIREAVAMSEQIAREEAERKAEAERIAQARENADVRKYIATLIKGMKDGSVRIEGRGRNKGARYTPSTIKMWENLAGILERFYAKRPFTWESIDNRFATRFRTWMEEEGYMAKSVRKYMAQFVALINRAYKDGKHANTTAASSFLKPSADETEKAAEIYLTTDELNALYQMPLTGEKELVRDIFIIGCCTCQRISDYSRLRKDNFVTTARGTRVVKIQQQKTRNFVTIPVLDNKLNDIMEKYGYDLPKLPASFDQILNRQIKIICKELSESVPSLSEEIPTVLTMKERTREGRGEAIFKRDELGRVLRPRYELVTSHTARRTGITHLYLTGKFDIYQMMHVSGHKEAKTFREYIKLSGDEMAEQIAAKMGSDNLF